MRVERSFRLLAALALVACQEQAAQVTAPPVPQDGQSVAYVRMVPARPLRGDTVAVEIHGRTADSRVGSFTVMLRYDSTRLRFLHETSSGPGMRAFNAGVRGQVRVAGAAPTGFEPELPLFSGRFVATGADPAAGLQLEVTELSGASLFTNLMPRLMVSRIIVRGDVPAAFRAQP